MKIAGYDVPPQIIFGVPAEAGHDGLVPHRHPARRFAVEPRPGRPAERGCSPDDPAPRPARPDRMALRRSRPLRRRALPTLVIVSLALAVLAACSGSTAADPPRGHIGPDGPWPTARSVTARRLADRPRATQLDVALVPAERCRLAARRALPLRSPSPTAPGAACRSRSTSRSARPTRPLSATEAPVELDPAVDRREPVTFYSTSLFVPAGGDAAEDVAVTPAQWFADRGRFDVTASIDGDAGRRRRWSFDVGRARRSSSRGSTTSPPRPGSTTTVPEAECGQFSNGAGVGRRRRRRGPRPARHPARRPGAAVRQRRRRAVRRRGRSHGASPSSDANGVGFADYDNDGDADLVHRRATAPTCCCANDGDGRFTDVSAAAGIGDDDRRGMNASWGDFDGDGVPRPLRHQLHALHRRVERPRR